MILKTLVLKIFIFLGFILVLGPTTIAQSKEDNTAKAENETLDALDDDDDTTKLDTNNFFYHLKYKLSVDGQYSAGNVNRVLTIYRGFFDYHRTKVGFSFNPNYTYGLQNGNLAEDDWLFNGSASLFPKAVVHALTFGSLERSHLRSIYLRWQAGAGPSIHLITNENHKLNVNNVILYESTSFYGTDGFWTIRNSTRFKGKHSFFKNRLIASHETYFQPSILDSKNYRFRTLVTIDLPINRLVAFRIAFQDSYDNIVGAGKQRNDFQFTFGLAIGNQF